MTDHRRSYRNDCKNAISGKKDNQAGGDISIERIETNHLGRVQIKENMEGPKEV